MTKFVAKSPLVSFFVLAFAFSWAVTIPMVIFRGPPQWTVLATFGPAIAALAVNRIAIGKFRFWTCNARWPRIAIAAAAGVVLGVTAYVVYTGIITADPRKLNWSILLSLGVFNYSTILGGPLGEEIGWTGYALPRLEERFGALPGTSMLGLLWALWHLPFFMGPGYYSTPLWTYALIVLGLRLIMSVCVNWSENSITVAVLIHAAFNTASRWLVGLYGEIQPQTSLPIELVLSIGGLMVAAILIAATKGRLAYLRAG